MVLSGCDKVTEGLDDCGLPFVGHLLKAGDPLYRYVIEKMMVN